MLRGKVDLHKKIIINGNAVVAAEKSINPWNVKKEWYIDCINIAKT